MPEHPRARLAKLFGLVLVIERCCIEPVQFSRPECCRRCPALGRSTAPGIEPRRRLQGAHGEALRPIERSKSSGPDRQINNIEEYIHAARLGRLPRPRNRSPNRRQHPEKHVAPKEQHPDHSNGSEHYNHPRQPGVDGYFVSELVPWSGWMPFVGSSGVIARSLGVPACHSKYSSRRNTAAMDKRSRRTKDRSSGLAFGSIP